MTPRAELRGPGTETLRLISHRAVRDLLATLSQGSRRPAHINRDQEIASSTFHRHVPRLLEVQAITRRSIPGPPRQVLYALGPAGTELCGLIEGWLALQPEEDSRLGDDRYWRAPTGLAEAWAANVIQALLDGPLGFAEIELVARTAHPHLTPHQVKRLLANNCGAGFLVRSGESKGERFTLEERGRHAVAELVASARFERHYMGAIATPISVGDLVGAMRAHLPLLELPKDIGGICELAVEADAERGGMAMAWAEVGEGKVKASGAGPPPQPGTCWTRGTIDQWTSALVEHSPRNLRPAGQRSLGRAVIEALHRALYQRDDHGLLAPNRA